ncbi:ACAA2, partial [Symbiodinium sp. KB8]
AKRTAIASFGGSFAKLTATDLATHASKAAIAACGVDPAAIDASIWGNVAQTSVDAPYLARHAGLRAGMRHGSTALTLNRLCGSGFQSVITAAEQIMLGQAEVVLAGGSESMSQAPLSVYGQAVRFGHRLGMDLTLQDTLWAALTDSYAQIPMGLTAENLAEKYGISREDADAYALQSQMRWKAAFEAGVFDAEIAPVSVKDKKKGAIDIVRDETPRVNATVEAMAKLPPVFKKNGTVTAANASGIGDGAAALIVTSEAGLTKHNLTPLARLTGWSVSGVDPSIMGIGPSPAILNVLEHCGITIDDVDRIEVNEAFASQCIAVMRDLSLDASRTNVHGGAIAMAHPLGASGARITTHLANQLAAEGGPGRAIGSACIGGGQGIAVVLERV